MVSSRRTLGDAGSVVRVLQRRRCPRGAACWCTAWRACRARWRWRWRTWCSATACACATHSSWCAAARRTSRPTSTSCASCTRSSATWACTSTAPVWVRSAPRPRPRPRPAPGPRPLQPRVLQVLAALGVREAAPAPAADCGCAPAPAGVSPDSGIEFDRWSAARDTPQWQFFTPPPPAPRSPRSPRDWAPPRRKWLLVATSYTLYYSLSQFCKFDVYGCPTRDAFPLYPYVLCSVGRAVPEEPPLWGRRRARSEAY